MASSPPRFKHRFLHKPYDDILAVVVLLSLFALYVWLSWARCWLPFTDQGWYMQVTARVVAGQVLYRDVFWIYGPLPVYALGLLYRLLRVDAIMFPLLCQILASLACLLTYRAARFLLPAPLALLSTAVVFLGSWGGFHSYIIKAYTGAVPLGAVLGLLFVVCLLSYLKNRKSIWLIAAGVATGGGFLTKPEFALACAGTGLLFLIEIVLLPKAAGFASRRGRPHAQHARSVLWTACGIRALAIYVVSAAIVVGIGYGVLAYQAGWHQVWAGITCYDQAALLLWVRPAWGTLQSWCYILSGLGVYLLIVTALIGILAPAIVRKHLLPLCILVVLCLALIVLPWGFLSLSGYWQLFDIAQVLWVPGPLLSTVLIIALSIHWFRAYRRKQTIDQKARFYAVLVVYSTLVVARFYFNPTSILLPYYVDTLLPVFVFSLAILIPQAMKQWGQTGLQRSRAQVFLAAILLLYAAVGFILEVKAFSRWDLELVTPRGTVLIPHPQGRSERSRIETLQYIISHTEPGDSIAVLGFDPGFYFLSGRKNPLRQDLILPGIGSSPANAQEIVRRLETHQPKRIIIPRWIEENKALLWWGAQEIGREYYENLTPVWRYVHDHYRVHTVIGGEEWGYTIYAP